MSLLAIAKQQQHSIPGAELISFSEKYFPIYTIDVTITVRDKKGMPMLEKFILKLVKEKVDELYDITLFLGVSDSEVLKACNQLIVKGYLFQAKTLTGMKYKLTSSGYDVVEKDTYALTKEDTFTVKMDAISANMYLHYELQSENIHADEKNMVLRERLATPQTSELTKRYSEIKKLYQQYSRSRLTMLENMELDDIIGISNWFMQYKKMYLLVFKTSDDEFKFQVFDRNFYCPEYDKPLSDMAKSGIEIWDMEEEQDYEELVNTKEKQPQLLNSWIETFNRAPISQSKESLPISYLTTTDHFAKMQEAFQRAKNEVIIISPWVSNEVISDIELDMKGFLNRGGKLYVGYGYPKDTDRKRKMTKQTIDQMRRKLGTKSFFPVNLADTHEKILICDEQFVVIGSYNWLSFRGDRKRGFTSETSVCIEDPHFVSDMKKRVMWRLEGQKGE